MTSSQRSAVVEVVAPGRTTTVQDRGRVGMARYGVPRSGPVDVLAHRLAARLAGVPADAAAATVALEVGVEPCRLGVDDEPVGLAVAGEGAHLDVGGTHIPAPCVVVLSPGETAVVTARTWAYVVPAGDVILPSVLGSRSRHPRSGLGPSLDAGTRLVVEQPRQVVEGVWGMPGLPGGPLHVLPAPQTDLFERASRDALVTATWSTTTASDRMGARLDGPELRATDGHDIVSDGIVAGALQVPGDGQPFVLLADHQTTGGYPKIGVLATIDLARFVRLPPGSPVTFTWSDVATGRRRMRAAHDAIDHVAAQRPRPHAHALGRANLIGGVADPHERGS